MYVDAATVFARGSGQNPLNRQAVRILTVYVIVGVSYLFNSQKQRESILTAKSSAYDQFAKYYATVMCDEADVSLQAQLHGLATSQQG